jgi:hypothetical protein
MPTAFVGTYAPPVVHSTLKVTPRHGERVDRSRLGLGGTSDGELGAEDRIKSVSAGVQRAIEFPPEKFIANSLPHRINSRADLNFSVSAKLKHREIFNACLIPDSSAKDKTMKSSCEDAILLLKSWKDNGALIRCTLITAEDLIFVSWAWVTDVSDSAAQLTGRASSVSFFFKGAEFEYSEPSELEDDSKLRLSAEGQLICLLGIGFPSGTTLFLAQSPRSVPQAE